MAKYLTNLLVLLVLSFSVNASTVLWSLPTTRINGSQLSAAEIAYSDVQIGTCNGLSFGTLLDSKQVASPGTVLDYSFPTGTSCIQIKVTDLLNQTSDPSNVFSFTVLANPPSPPVIKRVIWGGAYKFYPLLRGGFGLVYTGTSTVGAMCIMIPGMEDEFGYGFGISNGLVVYCGP